MLPISERRFAAVVLAALALFGGALAVLDASPPVRQGRAHAAQRRLPTSAFPSGDALIALRRLDLLHALPPAASVIEPGGGFAAASSFVGLDRPSGAELARALGVEPAAFAGPLPVAAVVTPRRRLETLHANAREHGAAWEVPAFFAWVEGGQLRFSSRSGLRLHGNASRLRLDEVGYRIYFRRTRGGAPFPPELLPGYQGPGAGRLLLRHDGELDRWGTRWWFVVSLATDILQRVGVEVPAGRPARFYLNGRDLGERSLIEHISAEFLRERYGHDRFALFDTDNSRRDHARAELGSVELYRELARWVRRSEAMTLERLGERIDLDNLLRWYVGSFFNATGDRHQGFLARDLTRPEAKWFWIAFDLDKSFGAGFAPSRVSWEIDNFDDVVTRESPDLRSAIFRRMKDDPAFRQALTRLFVETLNHRLPDPFLAERVSHYRALATNEAERASLDRIEAFLRRRKEALRRQLDRHWQAGAAHAVTVVIPPGREVLIDGYPYREHFAGRYFASTPIELRPARADRRAFSHWLVNGRRVEGPTLRLEPGEALRIDVVFSP